MDQPPCPSCQSLELTLEKFTITPKGLGEAQPAQQDLQRANERIQLATLASIRDGDGQCPLCTLIARTLDGVAVTTPENIACYLRWEIDGRRSIDERGRMTDYGTRRLRICWGDPSLSKYDSYIVLGAQAEDFAANINYTDRLNDRTQFFGRHIGPVAYKRNLIRQFLRLCEEDHDRDRCGRNLGIEDPFRDTLREPYFGVIDVENDHITPLPFTEEKGTLKFAPYATVSYVWGTSRAYRTMRSNVQSRRQRGGLAGVIPTLPKALRQSILLVQSLGIRYIWIDALCIVQDSSHSWNLNSRAMHLIYGNSTLTVCAADGDDGMTGLLAIEENHQPVQHTASYAAGVRLVLHKPSETSIESSAWNRRAWTFQERLLSKCCLIFTGGTIHFQCRSTCLSEDIFADREGKGWSLDLVRAPLQMLSQLKRRAIWFYAHCVYLYTQRELFEPFDILAAFSGMCKLIQGTTCAPFTFGLPTSHLDFALLWVPVVPASRLVHPRNQNDPKYHDMQFPSWAWCGWKNRGIRFNPDMVDGCTEDIRSWLLNHTWIDWHIRDGHGNLRPLWDRSARHLSEDKSIDQRWRGYVVDGESAVEDEVSESTDSSSDTDDSTTGSTDSSSLVSDSTRATATHARRIEKNTIFGAPTGVNAPKGTRRVDWDVGKHIGRDNYGRTRSGIAMKPTARMTPVQFELTLPEDPYNVRTVEARDAAESDLPDQPYLQFFTWRAPFHVVRTIVRGDDPAPGLCRCHIIDFRGDKCGSIVVDDEWLRTKDKTKFEFIAISEAKSFTEREFPDWTYYIPKEREESEWDLYFVLLVEYFKEEGIYRRVALGKICKAAFAHSDEEWKEIILG